MFGRNTVESFQKRQEKERLTDSLDLGLRTVEVNRIVGSVNRWQDFDSHFRIRNHSTRTRYEGIKRAMEKGEFLPPVQLYKVAERYYVCDGNHRVAAAKQVGQTYIDAHVIEYLPPADTKDHLLWRERSAFERKTDLTDIQFSQLGNYEKLLRQIDEFREEESLALGQNLTLKEAAQSWYYEIYQPVAEQIQKEKLLDEFPGRTEADLFLYATYHKMAKSRLLQEQVSYRDVLADFKPTSHKSLAEKIIDTITGVFSTPDPKDQCSRNLIIDEDGLVKVTKDCRTCTECKNRPEGEAKVISYDELDKYYLP